MPFKPGAVPRHTSNMPALLMAVRNDDAKDPVEAMYVGATSK